MESRFAGGKMIVDSSTGRMTGEVVTQSARDTTGGRVMKVGDAGALVPQAAITDLTVTLTPGDYTFAESTATGSPGAGVFSCYLHVFKMTGNQTGFLAFRNHAGTASNAKAWFGSRTADTGAITWVEFFTTGNVATSIAATPLFVGQVAVAAGVGYIAVGVASSADWKQITA